MARRKRTGASWRPKMEPHRPDLKSYFEAVWQDTKVRHPSNITLWNGTHGYAENTLGLFHDKGRQTDNGAKRIAGYIRRLRPPGIR
jgi:hypothetical protein